MRKQLAGINGEQVKQVPEEFNRLMREHPCSMVLLTTSDL
jgi:hypothetical protein